MESCNTYFSIFAGTVMMYMTYLYLSMGPPSEATQLRSDLRSAQSYHGVRWTI